MDYEPSKKLGHADGLSRLIPKYCEPLEDTVILTLKDESEIKKNLLVNTVRELPVTAEEIKVKSETDDFIKKMKNPLRFKENRRDQSRYKLSFNLWRDVDVRRTRGYLLFTAKRDTKGIPFGVFRDV